MLLHFRMNGTETFLDNIGIIHKELLNRGHLNFICIHHMYQVDVDIICVHLRSG